MRTILWFAYFWGYLLVVQPLLLRVRGLGKKHETAEHDRIVGDVVGRWARRLLAAAGARMTVLGLENLPPDSATPAVYVSNHQGYFDIPTVLGYLGAPKGLVAKKEIQRIPMIRSWMHELGCVFLDRENLRASMQAINDACDRVANGYPMVVFPEGTRSKTREVGEFKAGAFKVAQKNGAPVVPFFIDGTDLLMERNGYWIHPADVTLCVLPPIDTAGYTREDWKALPALCQQQIAQALAAHRAGKEA